MFGEPKVARYRRLFQEEAGPRSNLRKDAVNAHGPGVLSLPPHPLVLAFVDPELAFHPQQDSCLAVSRLIARLRLGIEHPAIMPVDSRLSHGPEVEGIHHLFQHGVILITFLEVPRNALVALAVGFMTSLQNLGDQLALLFGLFTRRER